jgi:hypothetical protein
MKIADIRPQHLNQLYDKLLQPGQRRGTEKVSAKEGFNDVLAEKDNPHARLIRVERYK